MIRKRFVNAGDKQITINSLEIRSHSCYSLSVHGSVSCARDHYARRRFSVDVSPGGGIMNNGASVPAMMAMLAASGIGRFSFGSTDPVRSRPWARMEHSVLVVRHRVAGERRAALSGGLHPSGIEVEQEDAPGDVRKSRSNRERTILVVQHAQRRRSADPDGSGADVSSNPEAGSRTRRLLRPPVGRRNPAWQYHSPQSRAYQRTSANPYRPKDHRKYRQVRRRGYQSKRSWAYHPR